MSRSRFFSSNKKRNFITILMVLVIVAAIMVSILMPLLSKPNTAAEGETFSPMPAKTSETVEMLRDLPQDFTVDITSNKNITQQNLSDFVTVTNIKGIGINVEIEKRSDCYTILPPASKYDKGEYYTIELHDAKFKDEKLSSQSSLLFATGKEDVTDIQLKKDLNKISEDKILVVTDDTIDLIKEAEKTYKVGDMLLIPDPEDGLGEAAYKIEEIIADNGNIISLKVSNPSLDEVYGKVEIYGNQNPTFDDLVFFTSEEIEKELLNNESVRAVGFACAVLDGEEPYTKENNTQALATGWNFDYDVDVKPAFKKPEKVDQDIFNVKLNPLEFSVHFEIVWKIDKVDAKVTLTSDTIVTFEAFTNVDNEKNIYSSGTRSTMVQNVNLKVEMNWSSPTFEEQQKKGMLKYFNNHERVQNTLNSEKEYKPAWAVQSLVANANGDDKYFDLVDNKEKNVISEGTTINNFIRGKSSGKSNIGSYMTGTEDARKQVQQRLCDLVSCYEQGQQGMDSNLLPFVTIAIPLPYGCSIHVRIGVRIVVNFSAVFEGNANMTTVDERVDVTTEDGTESYENKSTKISITAIIQGSFDAKFALAVDTKLTLAKIFYISLEVEGGVYFETEGYGGVLIGDYDKDHDIFKVEDHEKGVDFGGAEYFFDDKIAIVGHFYCDFGLYFGATLKSGLSLDLIIVQIDVSVSLSYEKKWSIFDLGQKEPEYQNDLIFAEQLKGKFKNEIASGLPFKDDLLFGEEFIEFYGDNSDAAIVMEHNEYSANLPTVLRRTINLKTREVTYEPIPVERLHFDLDEGTSIDVSGRIEQRDRSNPVIDDLVWITAEDKAGNMYSIDEFAYLRITKDPIPVDAVELSVVSDKIYPDSEIFVYANINPDYASYQDIQYEIVNFIHNGVAIDKSEISKYVYFDENFDSTRGRFVTTGLVSIGDKIVIRGIAKHDNIASEPLELTIIRRPVESLSFITQNRQTTVVVGQELPFEVFVYPLNSTFNVEGSKPSIIVNTPDLAEIVEKDGKMMLKVVDDINAFGKAIELTITANDNGNIVRFDYSMMIIQVPIDTLKITNENLTELGETTLLNQGQSINLIAKAEPVDATVLRKIQILKNVSNEYVTIDETGTLHISKNAPIGYEFAVSARYDNLNSKNYRFVVDKIATEKVNLSEQSGQKNLVPCQQLLLKTSVEPLDATFFAPEYIISEGAEWASIGYTGLLTIHEDAPIGAVISVHAMVDGVESNTLTFQIPAQGINIIAPKDVLNIGDRMMLDYDLSPTNNVILPVTFRIVEGEEFASITQTRTLVINNNVSIPNARIGIVAEIDGVSSDVYYIDVNVPVTSIDLYSNMSAGTVELGGSILLNTNVNPEYATNQEVEFKVDKNHLAQINNGWLNVTDDAQYIGEIIEVIAMADGVESNVLRIRITKVAVLDVEFIEDTLECNVNIGGNKTLYASAIPGNATNNEVSYRIISGMNLATIEGNILTVNETAQIGSRIEIIASADGVDSTEKLVVIVTKIDVERVDLTVEGDKQSIAPSETARFKASICPATATESIVRYSIVGEGRNYAYIDAVTGELTVNPTQLIVRGDIVIQVIATADGVSSKAVSLPIIVPVTDITMLGDDITVECGNDIKLSAFVNSNATNKNVEYRLYDDTALTLSNKYAIIQDDILHIKDNIFVPDAEIMVVAIPEGASTSDLISNVRTVRVHIPVKTVSVMSNKTSIMLGESATLRTSIFPAFASNQNVEYSFVNNFGNVTNAPWGVTLTEDTINVVDDISLLSSTPRFMVCAFVDGVASNVWNFEIIERPVTKLSFDEDNLQCLLSEDKSFYEVHPNVDYNFVIKAAVNDDASYKEITFTALTGDAFIDSVASAENISFDGLWYSIRLNVHKNATVGDKITILAQSKRNLQIRAEIEIVITAIYADTISGANITSVSSRGKNSIILDGAEFGGNLNGYTSNYINPGDVVTINNLYYDDENANNFKNISFGDKYTLSFNHTKFVTATEKGFTVLGREEILAQIKPGEDYFVVTVSLDQENGKILTREFKFFIFIDVKTVQFVDGHDGKGNQFKMTADQKLYVDRHIDEENANEFTFHFSINNATFTTNRLLLINGVELSSIKEEQFSDNLDAKDVDMMKDKTAPQITFSTYGEYCNEIKIKFYKWYNTGTEFEVVLLNPDHAANRDPLYRFTLYINPVNESKDFRFGQDGKVGVTGVLPQSDSYKVINYDGPVAINGIKKYADLRIGFAVELELGVAELGYYGQQWELISPNVPNISVKPKTNLLNNSKEVSKFIIETTDSSKDSYVENKLIKLVFRYVDGKQDLGNVTVYIRIVNLLESTEIASLRNGYDTYLRAEKSDLFERVYYSNIGSNAQSNATYITPNFEVLQSSAAKISDDGRTLIINNFNFDTINVRFTAKQYYNNNVIDIGINETKTLSRRFIANISQLRNINQFGNQTVTLIKDLNLTAYSNINLGTLDAKFDGNGHTIRNIKFSVGDEKLKSDVSHGLFSKISSNASVSNLTLENVKVTSGQQHKGKKFYNVGALAFINEGTIDNVYVKGSFDIVRQGSVVGGIVSTNKGTISNSKNYASIRGSGDIGGIAGRNEGGTIRSCTNYGDIDIVYNNSRSIGGIVGYNYSNGYVKDCNQGGYISSETTIKGEIKVGAIIGHNQGRFDGSGFTGSFHVTYTTYDGFIFGWGAYDNGTYLFAYYNYRVGKQG